MQCNLNRTDRTLRVIVGLGLLAAGAYCKSWWGLLAIVPLHNGLFGHCYLYRWLGINTNRLRKKKS